MTAQNWYDLIKLVGIYWAALAVVAWFLGAKVWPAVWPEIVVRLHRSDELWDRFDQERSVARFAYLEGQAETTKAFTEVLQEMMVERQASSERLAKALDGLTAAIHRGRATRKYKGEPK